VGAFLGIYQPTSTLGYQNLIQILKAREKRPCYS